MWLRGRCRSRAWSRRGGRSPSAVRPAERISWSLWSCSERLGRRGLGAGRRRSRLRGKRPYAIAIALEQRGLAAAVLADEERHPKPGLRSSPSSEQLPDRGDARRPFCGVVGGVVVRRDAAYRPLVPSARHPSSIRARLCVLAAAPVPLSARRSEWAHAARRRGRHLRGRRRHPLAQGQGRGVRRAARRVAPRPTRSRPSRPTSPARCASGAPAWAGARCSRCPPRRPTLTLTVLEVHEAFERIAALSGAGSQAARAAALPSCSGARPPTSRRAARRRDRRAPSGRARRALVAERGGRGACPLAAVRRAAMLRGATGRGRRRGARRRRGRARRRSGSRSGRRCGRCWPRTAPDVAGGDGEGRRRRGRGRHQARRHPDPGAPRAATTSAVSPARLDDITARLPEVVEVARSLPATSLVLDGEAIALDEDGPAAAVPGDRVAHAP